MSGLRPLKTLVAVARGGSFAAAAAEVSLTQAAVSLQMRTLESELGCVLFDRGGAGGRMAQLNAAGRVLLPWAEQMLALEQQMQQTLHRALQQQDMMTGAYRLGSIVSAVAPLARAVVALKQAHARLELKLVSAKAGELARLVEQGRLDAAVLVRSPGKPAAGLRWISLYDEPLVLLAPAATRRQPVARLLAERPFLRFDRNERTGMLVERALRRLQAPVQEFLELNSIEALAGLVRQEVGVALLPHLRHAGWEQDPALRVLPLPGARLQRNVGLLYRREIQGPLTEAIAARFHRDIAGT